jgi:hypothetical protein
MLAKTPQDLEQLAEAVAFQKRLVDDKARIAGRFEPLRYVRMLQWGVQTFGFQVSECRISTVLCRPAHFLHLFAMLAACLTESTDMSVCRDKYHVLERFEVLVPDAQVQLLDKLDGEWAKFQVRPSEGETLRLWYVYAQCQHARLHLH